MANIPYNPDEEKETDVLGPNAQQAPNITQPQLGGQTSGFIQTDQQPQSNQAGPKKTPKGSGFFTGLRKYVQANQNAVPGLSQRIETKGQQTSKQLQSEIGQKEKGFQTEFQKGEQKLADISQFTGGLAEQAVGAGAVAQPDIERFRNIIQGKESATEGLAPPSLLDQQRRIENLSQSAQGASSERGRERLLQETYGQRDKYTEGQKALDSLLLARSPATVQGLQSSLQQSAQQAGTLEQDTRRRILENITGLGQRQKSEIDETLGQLTGELSKTEDLLANKRALTEKDVQRIQSYKTSLENKINQYKGYAESFLKNVQQSGNTIENYLWAPAQDKLNDPHEIQKAIRLLGGVYEPIDFNTQVASVRSSLGNRLLDVAKQLQGTDSKKIVEQALQQAGLQQFEDIQNITPTTYMSPEEIARVKALEQLIGRQDSLYSGEGGVTQQQLTTLASQLARRL